MKRYAIIKRFLERLNDDDIAIFCGEEICKEAFLNDRPGNFYITNGHSIAASLAIGMASGTDKKIYIFSGEGNFLREAGALIQLFVSQLRNLFYILLNDGCYQSAGGYPNIFNEMDNPKGFFYNIGFILHDFTYFFNGKQFLKDMKPFMSNMIGPLIIFISVDKGLKDNLDVISYSELEVKNRIVDFITGGKE
jgi:hypothetical protein